MRSLVWDSMLGRKSTLSKVLTVAGLEQVAKMFGDLAPREAKNLSRRLVTKIAAQVRNDVRKSAKQKVKKHTGNLFKAIRSKRDKGNERRGEFTASVVINLRPSQGTIAPHWHFIEFGTVKQTATPFIAPVVKVWEQKMPGVYREEFGKQLEKELAKKAKRALR